MPDPEDSQKKKPDESEEHSESSNDGTMSRENHKSKTEDTNRLSDPDVLAARVWHRVASSLCDELAQKHKGHEAMFCLLAAAFRKTIFPDAAEPALRKTVQHLVGLDGEEYITGHILAETLHSLAELARVSGMSAVEEICRTYADGLES